jgi:hypothetical protein
VANFVQGKQLRLLEYGFQVTKAALTLPQTATSTLYTVAGGRVVITSLMGTISTVIGAGAVTLSLGTAPTTGTANTAGIAALTTTLANKEAGTHLWLPPIAGGALLFGTNAGNAAQLLGGNAYVVTTGTITWTTAAASTTGAISWQLTYIPIDDGASVS